MSDITTSEEFPFELGQDPAIEELVKPELGERVAVIRTSDKSNFLRCRRRWGWQSHLRGNLTPIEQASPLWFGSGFHYALEDFHGIQMHPNAIDAFNEYVKATFKQAKSNPSKTVLPPDWPELTLLGREMIGYYCDTWLTSRPHLETFVYRGRPQVEVHAIIDLPITVPEYDRVVYAVTLDRITIDEDGLLWIVDYKTAKRIQTLFFQTDPQISSYCWAASCMYPGHKIGGFVYQQHRKDAVESPKHLATGKLSTNRTMKTTHQHYRKAIINQYGSVDQAPTEIVDFLNELAFQEDDSKDKFIRRDRIYRNDHQVQAEGEKIMMIVEDMLKADIPLYPHPTRECGNMCSFNSACVSMDDGSDWQYDLEVGFTQKTEFDSWRAFLPEEYKQHG